MFDKVHEKYSVSHNENRIYHHYFYEVISDNVEGEYFSLEELLKDKKVKENNGDVISFIREYYNIWILLYAYKKKGAWKGVESKNWNG